MTLRAHHDPVPADGADWLVPHRDTFLAELRGDGFAPGTIRHYRYVIDMFCSAIDSRDLGPMTVNEPVLTDIRTTATRDMTAKRRRTWNVRFGRFIEYLVNAGVLAPPPPAEPVAPDAMSHLRAEYESWLRHQRGSSEVTIGRHLCFLTHVDCSRSIRATPTGIERSGALDGEVRYPASRRGGGRVYTPSHD